ncbi:hypothetical protein D3C85_928990 [compost metagenome]
MENFPFESVEVPPAAPWIFTLTPGIGSLSSADVTVPVIVRSCAIAFTAKSMRMNKLCRSFFIIEIG